MKTTILNISSTAWNVVYTKPNEEKKVAAALKNKNIEHYLPLKKVAVTQWWSFKKTTDVPVLNSMIFVKMTAEQAPQVKKIPGVVNMLYWLDKPAQVKESEIKMLKGFLYSHSNVTVQKRQMGMFSVQSTTSTQDVINMQETEKLDLPSLGMSVIGLDSIKDSKVIHMHTEVTEIRTQLRKVA